MIVIDERYAVPMLAVDSCGLGRVAKRSVFFVVQQQQVPRPDQQVRPAIIVIVAGGTTPAMQRGIEPGFLGHILELSVSNVVV